MADQGLRTLAWAIGIALSLAALPAYGETSNDQPTDWAVVIAKLKDELFQRSGQTHTRKQLAIAHNNYGVQLGDQGRWDLAVQQLEEAMRLDGTNDKFKENLSRIYLNRAHDAARRHQLRDAMDAVRKAIEFTPDFAPAYVLLGELEYSSQRLREAKVAWQRAQELDPDQAGLAERLQRVTDELPVESDFERLSQAYFDLRYEEQVERSVGFDIRDALMDARRSVGSDFAYWPKHKLVVLLYSADSFRRLRQETPEWVAGQFDGKIRVPLPNGTLGQAVVREILFHEYTHAVVHDVADGKCPMWLNEGLAEYEGKTQRAVPLVHLARAYERGGLIPWGSLSDQFSAWLPRDQVALGYEESYSVVRYLIQRYGFWRVRRVLKAIADGRPWDAALVDEYRLKLPRLETLWRETLPELLRETP
jgi:tetratricopeptide (TPR) repeat protein